MTGFRIFVGRFRKVGFGCLGISLCACLLAGACGKKGPPMPPRPLVLQKVTTLTATAVDCTVVLRWDVPRGGDNLLVTGFLIFRARQDAGATDCADCPADFREVAKVYISDLSRADRNAGRGAFTQDMDCGYRYIYTVVGFTRQGIKTPVSDAIAVELPLKPQEP